MWRYVAPCRGPEISGGPGRLSSGTAAGSAALPSHCFHCLGHFSVGSGRSLFEGAEEGGGEVADTCSVALVVFQKVHP